MAAQTAPQKKLNGGKFVAEADAQAAAIKLYNEVHSGQGPAGPQEGRAEAALQHFPPSRPLTAAAAEGKPADQGSRKRPRSAGHWQAGPAQRTQQRQQAQRQRWQEHQQQQARGLQQATQQQQQQEQDKPTQSRGQAAGKKGAQSLDGRYKLPPRLCRQGRFHGTSPWFRGYCARRTPGGWTYEVDIKMRVRSPVRLSHTVQQLAHVQYGDSWLHVSSFCCRSSGSAIGRALHDDGLHKLLRAGHASI